MKKMLNTDQFKIKKGKKKEVKKNKSMDRPDVNKLKEELNKKMEPFRRGLE